jgi:hypothetical protein
MCVVVVVLIVGHRIQQGYRGLGRDPASLFEVAGQGFRII